MANPGVYYPYATDTAWPFLALAGALISVPLFGFAILMVVTGNTSRPRAVAAAAVALAVATVSVAGLFRADSDFREAETAHRIAYVARVGDWLEQTYGVTLADAELSGILTPAGISGEFEGATTFMLIRGDQDTGRLIVTDRNGAELLPIRP